MSSWVVVVQMRSRLAPALPALMATHRRLVVIEEGGLADETEDLTQAARVPPASADTVLTSLWIATATVMSQVYVET
ncbi:MAG TPA: hypothetical protein VN790_02790 [Steroidobacteraceae bacterium]|nr:hypothetical protein [Steroidobacteraceae bacterium]